MLLLTDERMDVELGDVTGSFATPVPRARSRTKMGVGASGLGGEVLGEKDGDGEEGNETVSPDEVGNGRGRGEEQEDENEEEGEKTVMFSKRTHLSLPLLFRVSPSTLYLPFHRPFISPNTRLGTHFEFSYTLPRFRNLLRPRRACITAFTTATSGTTAHGEREHAYEAWKWEVED